MPKTVDPESVPQSDYGYLYMEKITNETFLAAQLKQFEFENKIKTLNLDQDRYSIYSYVTMALAVVAILFILL